VIDGLAVARETGMGKRINTIMQVCFFALSGVMPRDAAIAAIKEAIEDTYGKRGNAAVERNFAAVDRTLAKLHEVPLNLQANASFDVLPPVAATAPEFVRNVLGMAIAGMGDMASALLKNGIGHADDVLADLDRWLEDHEYASIAQMCGCMSYQAVPDPNAYERGNYMKVLSSYTLNNGTCSD
jgi:hypothetical protein